MGFFSDVFSSRGSPALSIRKSISSKHSKQMDKEDNGTSKKKSIPKEVQELDQDNNGNIGHDELRAYMEKHSSLWSMLSAHCNISEKECLEIACDTAYQMAKLPTLGPDAGFEDLKGNDLAREPTIEEFSAFHLKLEEDPAYNLQFFHRTIFHTFDNDNDGYIKEEEIGDFVKLFYDAHSVYSNDAKVDLPPKAELQARMFYHFDINHDGRLDFHEFEPIVSGGMVMLNEVLEDKEAKHAFMEKRKQEQTFHKEYREEQERKWRKQKMARENPQFEREAAYSPTSEETFTDSSEELPPPPPTPPPANTPSTKVRRQSSTTHKKSPKKSKEKKASKPKDDTEEDDSKKSRSHRRGRSSSVKKEKGLRSSSKVKQRRSVSQNSLRSSGTSSRKGKRGDSLLRSSSSSQKGREGNDHGLRGSTKGKRGDSGLRNSMTSGRSDRDGADHGLRGSTKGKREDSGLRNSMTSGRSDRDGADHGLRGSTKGKREDSGLRNSMTSGRSDRDGADHGLRGSTKGKRDDSGLQNSMTSGRSDRDGADHGLRGSTKGKRDDSGLRNSMTSGRSDRDGADHGLRGSTKGKRDDSQFRNSITSGRSPRMKLRKSLKEDHQ